MYALLCARVCDDLQSLGVFNFAQASDGFCCIVRGRLYGVGGTALVSGYSCFLSL